MVQCEWLAEENTSECRGGSGKAVVVGSLTDIQYVLLEYLCVCGQREFGRKRTTSDFYFKRIPLVSVFTCGVPSPRPDCPFVFVVVQDGTAIISVVLQIAAVDPTAGGAGLYSFFSSGTQPSLTSSLNAETFTSLLYICKSGQPADPHPAGGRRGRRGG